jgi:formamidopyrimidine-DNA glycosylase
VPELPEVEVTRRQLEPLLLGRRIERVFTSVPSYFFLTPPAVLRRGLRGRRFEAIERVGKYLVARLDNGERLLLHLGMTGQIFGAGLPGVRLLSATAGAALTPEQQARAFRPDQHTHLRLRFDDRGPDVFFRDARKFGKVQLMPPDEPSARLDRLGPDALAVRGATLFAALRARRVPIKSLLLDQSLIAGVGNIYADEALFLAGVRPTRPGRRVTREECHRIARAIRRILRRSIATGGSSISDYVQPDGGAGAYQDERRVYAREGEPCPRCGTPIRRRVIGQRSAHYCPGCQR